MLGEQDKDNPDIWLPKSLTTDHKPESEAELARIEGAGGKVVEKSGVPRVVWNRPRIGKLIYEGPATFLRLCLLEFCVHLTWQVASVKGAKI